MNHELLIVEDDDDIRELLVENLTPYFKKIHEAKNGRQGLEILNAHKLTLIITDFNMPKLDGVEFIKMIKTKNKNIPIIVLTGSGTQAVRRLVWAYGIWEYFEKPFNLNEFMNSVRAVVQMTSQKPEVTEHSLRNIQFEEISVMLEKQFYTPFVNHCLNQGLSPATVTKRMILNYLQEKGELNQESLKLIANEASK